MQSHLQSFAVESLSADAVLRDDALDVPLLRSLVVVEDDADVEPLSLGAALEVSVLGVLLSGVELSFLPVVLELDRSVLVLLD